MNVQKRDGRIVNYDREKIINAIEKANKEVVEKDKITYGDVINLCNIIEDTTTDLISVEGIQDRIEAYLVSKNKYNLAKKYIIYRYQRSLLRQSNASTNVIYDSILKLISNQNKELAEENSNKNTLLASTQRDYIAGEVSRDISVKLLLPERISMAHQNGELHFHDLDYFVQPIFNCCLIDIKDMLDNGTCINGKMIESPKSFQVACTVTTQIIAAVASNQYGGQSVNVKHLSKYLRKSKDKYYAQLEEEFGDSISQDEKDRFVDIRIKDELKGGVQTMYYQINTLMTTNGQAPFVTLFLHIDEDDEYIEETIEIICEILRQRIQGIKNDKGVYYTPAFPKLVYVLDENNCLKGGKYDYVTKLAAECSTKRMYPDYISAKKMRENYQGNVFSCMGCRSFLSPWKDKDGNYKWEGRFNQGVVSINLPQIGIIANGDEEVFWKLLDERLDKCKEALLCRHKALLGTKSDISPIHWQNGAIAKLGKGEVIDEYLKDGYSTLSLGYIGIYETTYAMKHVSHTDPVGKEFAMRIMDRLNEKVKEWKEETGLGFALYGTPAESLCYRFARIDREKYGDIENVTDKGYYTNSYHIDVREKIDAFSKFDFEAEFQTKSLGGAISYVEIPNIQNNLPAMEEMIKYIYDHIQYGEFNTKLDVCHECGYTGEIKINKDNEWECPQCHNKDHFKMNVVRRTCGYIGENFWNVGKTKEIKSRVLHL